MNVQEPVQEGCLIRIPVELDPEETKPHFDQAYATIKKSANLPGFRPGKVPTKVLKQRFGAQIEQEAAEAAIKDTLPNALKETDITPLALSPVEDLELREDGGMNYVAVIEVAPEMDAYAWKGKKVEKLVPEITDEDVDRHIESMRRENALVSDADEGDTAEMEDRLTADLQEVDENGVAVIGSKVEDQTFELGAGFFGPDVDEKLVGMKQGESRRIEVKMPENAQVEAPQAASKTYDLTLKKLEKVALPELDDDFASQVNDSLETVDDLKKNVRDQLERFGQHQANQSNAMKLREAVLEAYTDIELPPSLVQQTLEDMVKRQKEESGNAYPEDMLRQFLAPVAEMELKWFFLRRALIDAEGIEATDDEIMEHVENYHKAHPETNLDELKTMFKSGEQRDQLADEIIMGKVMEVLHNNVEWDEKKIGFMELLQAAQGGGHHHHHH